MILLRHGQSFFNLLFTEDRVDPGIEDPELTELGLAQARQAAELLKSVPLSRVIISPYTRALQTAAPIVDSRPTVVEIMHEVRERAAFTCDIGSHPDVLAKRFPRHSFSHLPARWWPDQESELETVARADAFRRLMMMREDNKTTLLVSHWAFLLALSGRSLSNGEVYDFDPSAEPGPIDWE
jgi:glucosyl-3-phosphoglycerate phosphatase